VKTSLIILLFVLAVFLLIISPFVTIWSLNTLFTLTIEYTIWTWLAMVWLSLVTFGNIASATFKRNI
jgi:hypothetical protein